MRKGSWGDITTRELMDELLNAHYLSQTGFNPTALSQKLTTKLQERFFLLGQQSVPGDIMRLVRSGRWPQLIARLEATGAITKAGRLRYLMDLGEELRLSDTIVRYLTEVRRLLGKKLYSSRPHGEARAIIPKLYQ